MTDQPLENIFNFRRLNADISTSGQPKEDELAMLSKDGVETIINLGLHDHDWALDDEAACCAELGVEYIHIPVPFDAPSEADYTKFEQAIAAHAGKRVHVHCIVNARVTAFFYRHLRQSEAAAELMESVWRPGGVWAAFIGDENRTDAETAYRGRDYDLD